MTLRQLLTIGAFTLSGTAAAQCPIEARGEVIRGPDETGDDWLNALICGMPDGGDSVYQLLENRMGLDGVTLTWGSILNKSRRCINDDRIDGWGVRFIDGGYSVELVAIHRDQDTFEHRDDYAFLIDGSKVTNFLRQFIDEYASYDGFEFECLSSNDRRGDGWLIFASNPVGDFAINLYHPWFWHQTAIERGATLVHEVGHELEGHIDNDACDNGGSCDTAFGVVNAQTIEIIFMSNAMDAYQRDGDSRELTVVNFGQDVCGYLPLFTDLERSGLQISIDRKLNNMFRDDPDEDDYPSAAVLTPPPDPTYAVGYPTLDAGNAYLIDVHNNTRWPCAAVCNPDDFDFPAGPRACNEEFHPFSNAAINGRNRARCERLNDQIAEGVTPSDHHRLLYEAERMEACSYGASQAYLDMTCADVRAAANHVDDIAAAWPDPPFYVRGYNPEGAIAECTATYCAEDAGLNRDEAEAACYEWDDDTGCMAAQCGDLSALEAEHGRQSDPYFQAVLCRASRLGRALPSPEADGCDATYERCMIEDRYRQLWLQQLDGENCWSDSLERPGDDPLFTQHRARAGTVTLDEFVSADVEGPRVLQNACFMEHIECQTMESLVALDVGRMVRDVELGPRIELPDIWNISPTVYDRTLRDELLVLVDQIDEAGDFAAARDRLRQIIAQPEARVAMAELVGHDRFFRMGGAYKAEGYFSPRKRERFAGEDGAADPYAPQMVGLPEEEAALATLNARLQSDDWTALRGRIAQIGPVAYLQYVRALDAATTAVEALAIHDELQTAIIVSEN